MDPTTHQTTKETWITTGSRTNSQSISPIQVYLADVPYNKYIDGVLVESHLVGAYWEFGSYRFVLDGLRPDGTRDVGVAIPTSCCHGQLTSTYLGRTTTAEIIIHNNKCCNKDGLHGKCYGKRETTPCTGGCDGSMSSESSSEPPSSEPSSQPLGSSSEISSSEESSTGSSGNNSSEVPSSSEPSSEPSSSAAPSSDQSSGGSSGGGSGGSEKDSSGEDGGGSGPGNSNPPSSDTPSSIESSYAGICHKIGKWCFSEDAVADVEITCTNDQGPPYGSYGITMIAKDIPLIFLGGQYFWQATKENVTQIDGNDCNGWGDEFKEIRVYPDNDGNWQWLLIDCQTQTWVPVCSMPTGGTACGIESSITCYDDGEFVYRTSNVKITIKNNHCCKDANNLCQKNSTGCDGDCPEEGP